MVAVSWAEVEEMPSTELVMAIGLSAMLALGTCGRVGSHWLPASH